MNNAIFAVIEMDGSKQKKDLKPRLLGTGFFVEQDIFITAAHVISPSYSFDVYLINDSGEILKNPQVVDYNPAEDYAVCKISRISTGVLQIHKKEILTGKKAFCIGYPFIETKLKKIITKKIGKKYEIVALKINSSIVSGKIIEIKDITRHDRKSSAIIKTIHVLLDFNTKEGYSGGPLIINESNHVAGMVSSFDLSNHQTREFYPGAAIYMAK